MLLQRKMKEHLRENQKAQILIIQGQLLTSQMESLGKEEGEESERLLKMLVLGLIQSWG